MALWHRIATEESRMNALGLDIGGANLKAADSRGRTLCRPFPIWKEPDRLAMELQSMLAFFPDVTDLAVTMTAELADCFSTKAEGVARILEQTERAAAGRACRVWSTSGEFLDPAAACAHPMEVAAANWHALATWVGRHHTTSNAVLMDIGTTTTDLIPIRGGRPVTRGRTDVERLLSGELCYSGIRRTPLCAVAPAVPFRGVPCPLAAELFATTLDLYLLCGDLPEAPDDRETANGQPATRQAAWDRIARQLCGDRDEVPWEAALDIARFLADVQQQQLSGALTRVLKTLDAECVQVILSGSGAFLARRLADATEELAKAERVALNERLSPGIAESACAYALAHLAQTM